MFQCSEIAFRPESPVCNQKKCGFEITIGITESELYIGGNYETPLPQRVKQLALQYHFSRSPALLVNL
jgi:hypothetical protein